MKYNFNKYFLPLNDIPFGQIPSLKDFSFEYIECQEVRIDDIFMPGAAIITVFNQFHDNSLESFKNGNNILFGPLLSQHLSTRAKVKCVLKEKQSILINSENLPHLKFSNSKGTTFITKKGKYAAMYGEEVESTKTFHLEGIHIYGDWLLKLRVVIELLKQNERLGKVSLNLNEYKDIAYKILRKEPALLKMDDSGFKDAVNNWVPSMVNFPLMDDIPKEFIGKIIE